MLWKNRNWQELTASKKGKKKNPSLLGKHEMCKCVLLLFKSPIRADLWFITARARTAFALMSNQSDFIVWFCFFLTKATLRKTLSHFRTPPHTMVDYFPEIAPRGVFLFFIRGSERFLRCFRRSFGHCVDIKEWGCERKGTTVEPLMSSISNLLRLFIAFKSILFFLEKKDRRWRVGHRDHWRTFFFVFSFLFFFFFYSRRLKRWFVFTNQIIPEMPTGDLWRPARF